MTNAHLSHWQNNFPRCGEFAEHPSKVASNLFGINEP
jgi:hypothetical protein